MKKIMLILLLTVMCISAVCGCQPTPETPVVVGKNDGDNKITSLFGETSATESPYEAPESWKEETPITSGGLSVMIGAKVTVPDVTKFPVVKVDDHVFTQDEADELIASLSEGNELFPPRTEMTRADKEELLLVMKARLAEFKAKPNPTENDLYIIESYEDYKIPQLEMEIRNMPEDATAKPFTTNFQPNSITGGMKIEVRTDLGGEDLAGIGIYNDSNEVINGSSLPSGRVSFGSGFHDIYLTINYEKREVTEENAVPNGTSVTREEAIAQAEALMRKLGLTDIQLILTIPASIDDGNFGVDPSKQCWMFIYVPTVNGIPIMIEKKNMKANYTYVSSSNEDYTAVFCSPMVVFQISDSGILMYWEGPFDIQETLNENAILLPFEDIQARIRQQLPITYAAKEGVTEVHVTRIELNYMRARIKDMQDGYMLLPVWDVIGYTDEPFKNIWTDEVGPKANPEDFLETLLTINAMDGSVLDRRLGY
jgi:hypothetical protein